MSLSRLDAIMPFPNVTFVWFARTAVMFTKASVIAVVEVLL